MTDHLITADMLPGLLADIARITTPDIAIAVARKHGGRRLYIPTRISDQHALNDLMGHQAAALIVQRLGGERHDIPAARTVLRWYDAHTLRAEGKTHAEISVRLNITQMYVSRLLAGAPMGERQEKLHRSKNKKSIYADLQMNLFDVK